MGLICLVLILPDNMQDKSTRKNKEVWINQGRQDPHPNQSHIETQVPAIQAEQVEDDVAPVTEEYVPAKARDEEYG
jgi:hypothetical protein